MQPKTIIIEPLTAHCESCTRDFEYRPSRGEQAMRALPTGGSAWLCPDCYQDRLDDDAWLKSRP